MACVGTALLGFACGASSSDPGLAAGAGGGHDDGSRHPVSGESSSDASFGGDSGLARGGTPSGGATGTSAGRGGSGPAVGGAASGGTVTFGEGGGEDPSGVGGSSAGSGSFGGGGVASGGSAATGGSANCPPRPARRPSKVLHSSATLVVSDILPPTQFTGVTDIDGELDVADALGLAAFDCLETVSGTLRLTDGTYDSAKFGAAFPNLVFAKSIDVDANFGAQAVECLLPSLAKTHSFSISGDVTGTLNLAGLGEFSQIEVYSTDLRRVVLPSNGTFAVSQLGFRANYSLSDVAGFQNVTLTGAPGLTSPYYSLQFQSNPGVSGCRILELAQLFRAAGYVEGSIAVGTPTCP